MGFFRKWRARAALGKAVKAANSRQHDEAIRHATAAIEDGLVDVEDIANPWVVRGRSKGALGDYDGALADLSEAATRAEDNGALYPSVLILIAQTMTASENYEKAHETWTAALDATWLSDEKILIHVWRGIVRLRLGDMAGAKDDCDQFQKLSPYGRVHPQVSQMAEELVAGVSGAVS